MFGLLSYIGALTCVYFFGTANGLAEMGIYLLMCLGLMLVCILAMITDEDWKWTRMF